MRLRGLEAEVPDSEGGPTNEGVTVSFTQGCQVKGVLGSQQWGEGKKEQPQRPEGRAGVKDQRQSTLGAGWGELSLRDAGAQAGGRLCHCLC